MRFPHREDPLWARGFTYIYDIILENSAELGLTSAQIRMLLVLTLLAFRGRKTSYAQVARLTGTTPGGARKMIRRMEQRGWLEVDRSGPVHTISTEPYERKALALAHGRGERRPRGDRGGDIQITVSLSNLHFTRLPALVFEHPSLNLEAREIHLLLAVGYFTYSFNSYAGMGRSLTLSEAQIAELMGVHPSTVRRALASLEAKGYALRTTRPGCALSVDLSPLFNILRGHVPQRVDETSLEGIYTPETLEALLSQEFWARIDREVVDNLIRRHGPARVGLALDVLAWQYRNRRVRSPHRLLYAVLSRDMEVPEGFIPWPEKERMMRREREIASRSKRIEEIRAMLERRTEQEWERLPQDDREAYLRRAGEIYADVLAMIAPQYRPVNQERMALLLFEEEVVFDLVADEKGTPPERRERLRRVLYEK